MTKKILSYLTVFIVLSTCLYFSLSAYLRYHGSYVKVPVASHQLYQRTCLKQEDLDYVEVPKTFLTDDICTESEDVIGKYVKLSFSLPKGSFLYKGALEKDIRDLSTTLLKQGEAAYDLFTSDVKINTGNLSVAMYLDIYFTAKDADGTLSDLLFEGCRIIGLYDASGKAIREYEKDQRISVVSIAIGKEDVMILNKALLSGNLNVLSSYESYDTFQAARLNKEGEAFEYLR